MVVDPHNVEGDVLKELAGEVLFIGGTHGYEASNILFSAVRAFGAAEDHMDVLTQVVGLLGVARFPSQTGVFSICDLFIGPRIFPASAERMKDIAKHVDENRAMKWEIEVQRLIDSGEMRLSDLKKTDLKSSMLARFAEQISQRFARPND